MLTDFGFYINSELTLRLTAYDTKALVTQT